MISATVITAIATSTSTVITGAIWYAVRRTWREFRYLSELHRPDSKHMNQGP